MKKLTAVMVFSLALASALAKAKWGFGFFGG